MPECIECKKSMTHDETALYRRLFDRGADRFTCVSCISKYLDIPEKLLYDKIEYFKESGCTLFES